MQAKGYNRIAILLHWLLAVCIFFLFLSSWWMLSLPFSSLRSIPFSLHKNIGLSLVIVLLVFIVLRLWHRPDPITSKAMKPWMHRLTILDHLLLYVLIFAICISGYLSSAYSGWTTSFWWLVDLPDWGYKNQELNRLYSDIHSWLNWALLGVIAVHLAGAVYHGFRRDGVVRRMLRL